MTIKKGATDISIYVILVDSAAGTPETGLTITSIDATYTRMRAAAVKNDLTALGAANSSHADNQGIEVDSTNAPGLYRVDFPDAAFASGADKVILSVTCTGCAPAHLIVELVDNETVDVYGRLGAPAGASVSADVAAIKAETAAIVADTNELQTDWVNGGRLDNILDARSSHSAADVWAVATRVLTAGTNIVLPSNGLSNVTAWTVDITGSLSGSVGSVTGAVGSVTGAVGSVTGNVGGNVVGSVASVTGNIGGSLTAGERNAIADALLNRDMSAVSDTNSRSPLNAMRFLRNKWSISGTTLTVTKEDDATSAWTSTVTTNASADPVTGSDPA